MWFFGVEDLANKTDSGVLQFLYKPQQKTPCRSFVLRMQFQPCVNVWTYGPRPDGTLMIGRISENEYHRCRSACSLGDPETVI